MMFFFFSKLENASGPDGNYNRVLLEGVPHLAYPLQDLFNARLNSGAVPSSWKICNCLSYL